MDCSNKQLSKEQVDKENNILYFFVQNIELKIKLYPQIKLNIKSRSIKKGLWIKNKGINHKIKQYLNLLRE